AKCCSEISVLSSRNGCNSREWPQIGQQSHCASLVHISSSPESAAFARGRFHVRVNNACFIIICCTSPILAEAPPQCRVPEPDQVLHTFLSTKQPTWRTAETTTVGRKAATPAAVSAGRIPAPPYEPATARTVTRH